MVSEHPPNKQLERTPPRCALRRRSAARWVPRRWSGSWPSGFMEQRVRLGVFAAFSPLHYVMVSLSNQSKKAKRLAEISGVWAYNP